LGSSFVLFIIRKLSAYLLSAFWTGPVAAAAAAAVLKYLVTEHVIEHSFKLVHLGFLGVPFVPRKYMSSKNHNRI
jgi:hypothetical protein